MDMLDSHENSFDDSSSSTSRNTPSSSSSDEISEDIEESASELTEGDEISQLICSTDGLIESEQATKNVLKGA